jgi:alginate O-acetyltransferase complex protein AlgI
MADILFIKLLIIVPVALVVYYLLPRRLQNYWLLFVSYAFYISWVWTFPLVLLVLTLGNYVLALEIQQAQRGRRFLLWGGIAFNVLLVALFKYPAFFLNRFTLPYVRSALDVAQLPLHDASQILLPIGLSFAMLQAISYLVDVYRGQVAASSDLVDLALYFAYFPKLISGPIERARAFLPRLAEPRVVDNDLLVRSFTLIMIGLVRKLVIANPLQTMTPDGLFDRPGDFDGGTLLLWLIAYSFALYNDFAGYTSLVRGISGLFGIELSTNFQQPYFSRSFTEFWNRWHITFSHWLRDYIFFPLSRALLRRNPSRSNPFNLILPPLVTMLISGLWHGVNWHMAVWGGLHGLYQVVERVRAFRGPVTPPQQQPRWRQAVSMLLVFALTVLSWMFFRMQVPQAAAYILGLFRWTGAFALDARLVLLLVPALLLDLVQYRQGELAFLRWPRLAQSTALALAILALALVLRARMALPPFVYQAF